MLQITDAGRARVNSPEFVEEMNELEQCTHPLSYRASTALFMEHVTRALCERENGPYTEKFHDKLVLFERENHEEIVFYTQAIFMLIDRSKRIALHFPGE